MIKVRDVKHKRSSNVATAPIPPVSLPGVGKYRTAMKSPGGTKPVSGSNSHYRGESGGVSGQGIGGSTSPLLHSSVVIQSTTRNEQQKSRGSGGGGGGGEKHIQFSQTH